MDNEYRIMKDPELPLDCGGKADGEALRSPVVHGGGADEKPWLAQSRPAVDCIQTDIQLQSAM
jgi:hypothetical protein